VKRRCVLIGASAIPAVAIMSVTAANAQAAGGASKSGAPTPAPAVACDDSDGVIKYVAGFGDGATPPLVSLYYSARCARTWAKLSVPNSGPNPTQHNPASAWVIREDGVGINSPCTISGTHTGTCTTPHIDDSHHQSFAKVMMSNPTGYASTDSY
jgi:hypothetical protein